MPGFHTHIAFSTAAGIGYAVWGATYYDLPYATCALAGGLCSIAGIMPDLDSDSGVPSRETIGFAAAVVPMLVFNRLQVCGMSIEQMVLFGAPMYLIIRFGLGRVFRSASVHRGMFHSIPAVAIAGLIGYLVCDSGAHLVHNYKGFAVSTGYLIHLVLDEIWSVDMSSGTPHLKKSFGTALKFFGDKPYPAMLTYSVMCLLMMFAANEANQPPTPSAFARRNPDPAAPMQPGSFGSPPRQPQVNRSATSHQDGWQRPRAARRTRMDEPW
jgi:hypothetical protein